MGEKRLSTPGALRLWAVAALVPALVLGIVVASVAGSLSSGFDLLSEQAAPQAVASADLYVALGDMDAQVANVLLVGSDQGLSDNREQALAVYTRGRTRADADVQRVAAIGGAPVAAILDRFGEYQALAGEAMSLNSGGHDPAGHPSATELAVYRQATALMPGLLGATQTLIDTSQAALDRTYQANQSSAAAARVWVIVIGVLLLAALVMSQVVLRRRLRRRLNPAVMAATLVALAVTIAVPVLLSTAAGQQRRADQDALGPIIALSQARAVVQESAANESRYLVDPAMAAAYQREFQAESQDVLHLAGADIGHYDGVLRTTLDAYNVDSADQRFGGDFGVEAAHIDSTTERLAAIRAMARYAGFELADRAMRTTLAQGDLRDAIEFDTGSALGYSSYDLAAYDQALSHLIAIKQQTFDQAIRSGTSELAGWSGLLPAVVVVLIAGLLAAGVLPRLAEYRR